MTEQTFTHFTTFKVWGTAENNMTGDARAELDSVISSIQESVGLRRVGDIAWVFDTDLNEGQAAHMFLLAVRSVPNKLSGFTWDQPVDLNKVCRWNEAVEARRLNIISALESA